LSHVGGWSLYDHRIVKTDATAEYTVLRLTDNEFHDKESRITDNSDVVWDGFDGNDYEIFMYERRLDQVWQMTDNFCNDLCPTINNNGDIAWRQDDGETMRILFYE
jgi:hypothetical protein